MPVYERQCSVCPWSTDFALERWQDRDGICPACGARTDRVFRGRSPAVIPDTFARPVVDDMMTKQTQVFHSRSERNAAMKRHGVTEHVRHAPVPGTDKSKHTTRWT